MIKENGIDVRVIGDKVKGRTVIRYFRVIIEKGRDGRVIREKGRGVRVIREKGRDGRVIREKGEVTG